MSKNSEKTVEIFENAPIPKAVFVNIIPSVISMLMVLVYNLADTFFIGQTNNDAMVAAVSLATPAFLFFMAVGMLFGIGGTSLISRLLGQGREKDAKYTCSFCFWTGAVIGVIGMLIILFAVRDDWRETGKGRSRDSWLCQRIFADCGNRRTISNREQFV